MSLGGRLAFSEPELHTDAKHFFWTDNDLGNGLHDALLALVRAGILDRREEPDEQFRWPSRINLPRARVANQRPLHASG
jgi:hypothetical protein